jgi:hypothetical protein
MDTVRFLTLSRHLGPLTPRWVIPLVDYEITPVALTAPDLRWWHVWSLTTHRAVSRPKWVISALPHHRSPRRSACEQSREEPAIPRLDWTFTPIPRSTQGFAHHQGVGPPPHFRRASSCPGIDRLASGLAPVTPGERTSPLVDTAGLSLSLRLRRFTP